MRDGKTTKIAAMEDLPSGKITQIKLVLGDNNSVKYRGRMHDLFVPSGLQDGIKLPPTTSRWVYRKVVK
ncbi:MAG: DUF4382 domain-containing protein [Flavobacteriales bacterium]